MGSARAINVNDSERREIARSENQSEVQVGDSDCGRNDYNRERERGTPHADPKETREREREQRFYSHKIKCHILPLPTQLSHHPCICLLFSYFFPFPSHYCSLSLEIHRLHPGFVFLTPSFLYIYF